MSNRKSVVIPKGWRKLKPHECPRRGDKWKAYHGEWRDQIKNAPYRADDYYRDIIHIRRIKRPSKPASVLDGVRTWKMFIPYENGCTSLPYHLATETKRVDQDRPLRLVPESDWRKIVKELRREK